MRMNAGAAALSNALSLASHVLLALLMLLLLLLLQCSALTYCLRPADDADSCLSFSVFFASKENEQETRTLSQAINRAMQQSE